ncbi:MAG: TGS domain-containing protein, partial [Clostridia bacterium]|nr:TGS domain-containing protein [Clostridia bacterium]
MKITLKDGSSREYNEPKSAADICKDISEGLYRNACACKINGEVSDLRTVIADDANLEILTADDPDGLRAFRHTASHILAQAIKRLYPDVKLAIGPSIADGFYYDFDCEPGVLTSDKFDEIEAEMKKIVKEDLKIERFTLPKDEAVAFMAGKNEPYKVELIENLP